jgi:hypothetical protein
VPGDALVFTSLTGPRIDADEGWNYYPAVGERQLYIAGWADGELRGDDARLGRLLAANQAVLEGSRDPRRLGLSRGYGSFWAVTRRDEPAPPSLRRVYTNDRYALYRIASERSE